MTSNDIVKQVGPLTYSIGKVYEEPPIQEINLYDYKLTLSVGRIENPNFSVWICEEIKVKRLPCGALKIEAIRRVDDGQQATLKRMRWEYSGGYLIRREDEIIDG